MSRELEHRAKTTRSEGCASCALARRFWRHPAVQVALVAVLVSLCSAACGLKQSTWRFHKDLLEADRIADRRQHAEARSMYEELSWRAPDYDLLRYLRFRMALMLERDGQYEAALAEYAEIYENPYTVWDDYAARALYRTGRVYRDHYDDNDTAMEIFKGVIRGFPDTAHADDAFIQVRRDYEDRGDSEGLIEWLSGEYSVLTNTEIADNMLYTLARTLHVEMEQYEDAIEVYRLVMTRFTRSSLADDAVWWTADCYRLLGDREQERRLLSNFVGGREISLIMADYDYQWYSPSFFRLAEMAEEDEDWAEAISVYRGFVRTFPLSLKVDDVHYKIMELQLREGDTQGMRSTYQWFMDEYPDSRFVDDAQELLEQAGISL